MKNVFLTAALFLTIHTIFANTEAANPNLNDPPAITADQPVNNEITMLFAYTTQAACAVGGVAKIKENVENGLKLLNEALVNSNIGYTVRAIPEYVEVEYGAVPSKTDVDDLIATIFPAKDGIFNKVHQFRKQKQADMVCLIFSGYGMGQAQLNGDLMVTHYSTFGGSYVFPHEFGHNLGATHEAGMRFNFGRQIYRTVSNNGGVAIPYFSENNRTISRTENGETKTIQLGDASHDNVSTMKSNAKKKVSLGENLADVPSVSNALPAKLVNPGSAPMPPCQQESVTIEKCYIDDRGVLTIEYEAVDEVSFNGQMVDKENNPFQGTGFRSNLKPGESKWENRYGVEVEPGDKYIVTIKEKKLECPVGRSAASAAEIITIDESKSHTPNASDKSVWGVNKLNEVYRWDGSGWTKIPKSLLTHVSVGSDGTVWGVNAYNHVWRWDGGSDWTQIPQSLLKQVSVGSKDNIWGVNAANQIWRWDGSGWTNIPRSSLKHVSVGSDGTVWGVNAWNDVWRWDGGSEWTGIPGPEGTELTQISVGSKNHVWGVNESGHVYRFEYETEIDGTWIEETGRSLKYVSVASDGTVWGVGVDDKIYKWDGESNWTNVPGPEGTELTQISVAHLP
jgi:hypothetical protein